MKRDYDSYLRGMDASMRQKVALTAAHLLCEGELADMGMGSGSGSFALASLYPSLKVIGVDVDPEMVRRAQERYQLDNLSFIEGDIAARCFEDGSIEAILNSSVLHHVTSFSGYDRGAAARALEVQAEQLANYGVLIVRDFVDPGAGDVWLDVPTSGGDDLLFEKFAREFRSLHERPGCAFQRLAAPHEGIARFAVTHTLAAEFVLRKDYRDSWQAEIKEEYTFATQPELEATFAALGLRVLASRPIHNPWIVRHRFVDKFAIRDHAGEELDWPATNFIIVGQKVPPGAGVTISETAPCEPNDYLELSHFRHRECGTVYDLARRPGVVTDVLPWFEQNGALYVLARRGYPRPLLGRYITEPLNTAGDPKELLAGLQLNEIEDGTTYLPSPGGIHEEVRSVLAHIAPTNVSAPLANISGFSTSGIRRAIEARQLLRAAQVGGLPDMRLELNTYELLLRKQRALGDWIGEHIDLRAARVAPMTKVRPVRQLFEPCDEASNFLELCSATFTERDGQGNPVATQTREWVIPKPYSLDTVTLTVLVTRGDTVYIGLDDHDLPASQAIDNNSALLVIPAWRIPHNITTRRGTRQWIATRALETYNLSIDTFFELGGPYHPSAGLTPERVTPLATSAHGNLHWMALDEAVAQRHTFLDGHTRISILRAWHATRHQP